MRIARYTAGTRTDIGVVVDDHVYSLSEIEVELGRLPLVDSAEPPRDALIEWMWRVHDRGFAIVEEETLALAARVTPVRLADVKLRSPIRAPQKIIGQGNSAIHFEELRLSGRYPESVVQALLTTPGCKAYLSSANTISGPTDDVAYPVSCGELDYEVELAVVIGRTLKNAAPEEVLRGIFGGTVANDLTARDVQFNEVQTGMLNRAKSLDGFLPLGPWIETDWAACMAGEMTVRVNSETRQSGLVKDLDTPLEVLISQLSQDVTLFPGDIVLSGTLPGSASFQSNYQDLVLQPGDLVETSISTIGAIRNRIVAAAR